MLNPNSNFGHYKIKSSIGAGGMGEVFLAEDTKLDRLVAIKCLNKEFSEDTDKLRRFVQEAKSASALNHPNIITIYEVGEIDGVNFIATEYIEGETLTHKITNKSQNFEFVLETATQIASALDEAHSAGIVHRDIKSDNVMIRPNGLVKILDFGIAKLTEERKNSVKSEDETAIQSNTLPGMIIGTPNYMSPEQAKGKEIDERTDIFSFGVVLYEMVGGRLPFEGDTAMETIAAILHKEPEPLDESKVPSELENIINKALRKDKEKRYQTIKEVLNNLKDVQQELAVQEKLDKTVPPHREETKTQMMQTTTVDETEQKLTAESENKTVIESKNDSIIINKSSFSKVFAIGILAVLASAIGFGYWYFAGDSKQIDSIAVMPFVNETDNKDIEYLSDGMTETLISSLSNIPNLSVKARSTVFYYKGKQITPKKIGEELNVEAVLLGRLVQRDEKIKLNLELVETVTQDILWSENYERGMDNLVSLQKEIAENVSNKIKGEGSEKEAVKENTTNAKAYQAYLKGRFHWNKLTKTEIEKSIEYFNEAIEIDPNYALAWSGLSDAYESLPINTEVSTKEAMPKAKSAAEKAVSLDPNLAEARTSLANVLINYDWNFEGSEKEYKKAIELNSKYAIAHTRYGSLLQKMGRNEEAITQTKVALELDPLSAGVNLNLGTSYMNGRKYDQAIEQFQKGIEIYPDFIWNHYFIAYSQAYKKNFDEAKKACEKVEKLSNGALNLCFAQVFAIEGKTQESKQVLNENKVESENIQYIKAMVYSLLDDKDKAFEILEGLAEKGSYVITFMNIEPAFDNLREDSRYKDLVGEIGFPK